MECAGEFGLGAAGIAGLCDALDDKLASRPGVAVIVQEERFSVFGFGGGLGAPK